MPIVAWYMLSNESYMNLVIRDVFPTVARDHEQQHIHRVMPNFGVQQTYRSVPLETPTYAQLLARPNRNPKAECGVLELLQGVVV